MVPTTRIRHPRLETVRRRLDRWRAMRPHAHAAMPAALWRAAVIVAHQHGLYRTARALGLDYGALKRHAEATHPPATSRPTFVALPTAVVDTATVPCAIEIEQAGATVRLRLPGVSVADLVTVGRRLAGLEP
jgi:hypothetical protein